MISTTRSGAIAALAAVALLAVATPAVAKDPGADAPNGHPAISDLSRMTATAAVPPGYPVTGIDVSHHQGTINWSTVAAAGAKFSYAKATEGLSFIDSSFTANFRGAKQNGILAGAYHYARPDKSDGTSQANYFLDHAQYSQDGKTLIPMLDIEWPWEGSGAPSPCYGLSTSQMSTWVKQFVDRVYARTGQRTMIYTNTNWWNPCTGNNATFGANPLFIANYSSTYKPLPAGWNQFTLWQYSDSGSLPGDQDVFNGSLSQLQALAGGSPAPTPVADPDVVQLSGDFNGDGRDDAAMLYHYNDDSIELFTSLANASGGFGAYFGSYKLPANSWKWDSFRSIVGDFNGDGRSDLGAMYYQADGSITMHTALANTSGGFGAFTGSLTVPANAAWKWDAIRLTSGDFNGDGRDDAAMLYHHKDESIELFTSLGTTSGGFGTFTGSYKIPANSWKWNSFRTIAGDYNGDGRSDLAAMYYQADGSITMHTALANTSGGFAAFTGSLTVPASAGWYWDAIRLTTGDFNGDGRDDAGMFYRYKDESIELFTSLGTTSGGFGTFTGSYKLPANSWKWDSFRSITGDHNGDGRTDLAAMYCQADGSITMHTALANTSGGFGAFTGSLTVPASASWQWDAIRLL
ncbi:GH25 family lysozyme [Micromonospora parva]|uniref:GH25 family lysozyme n=1 Tax=Micromonospora parva TaxID=1464048 RepID=UPI0006894C46|nr:GH25 family lysozyme [Micromonospora parva]